uniref:Capping protein inhibiting regulator of actin dynamics n=1 Tax=Ursus maritimus TaxID=29073 RepID=A0A452TQU3_URSMA
MGEQKVSRQFKQCHRTTSWAKSKLFSLETLCRQLSKNIKFGRPPPNAIPMKKADSGEASLEEDLLLTSPMEIVTHEDIIPSDTENKTSDTPSSRSPLNLPGARSEMEEKVAPVKPSRPKRHFSSAGTIESVNLDAIPLAIARLDNSAAKHKLSVKPKNQRVSKKHRRLARDRPNEQGGLPRQLSLDQNGHSREDKPIWHEEEPELLDLEEEKRCQEEYWLELEAKCKRQKAEAAERRRLEEQRLQALERRLWEENRRQELLVEEGEDEEGEEADLQPEAEKRQREEESQRLEEQGGQGQELREQEEGRHLEEQRRQEAEKQQRWEEEEQQEREEQRRLREEEEEQEEQQEQLRLEEEQGRREEEEQRKREEQLRLEEEQRRREEKQQQREKEEQQEWEEKRRREEEQRREAEAEAERRAESPLQIDFAEKPGKREHLQPEKQRESCEEPRICEKRGEEAEPAGEQQGQRGDVPRHGRRARPEERPETSVQPPQIQEAQVEETPARREKKEAAAPEQDRKGEELRWQEVDERQSMPRPYTFQVSSGGKQILFPKVNLSPVTPVRDAALASAPHAPKIPQASPASHTLPSSLSVPHTAILVTGAQLCGPAVNLSQIKDTACKSLLGLSEEKKRVDVPALENPPRAPVDARAGSGKVRVPQESPSSVAALAEWASIRSRILKNAEGEQRSDRDQSRPRDEHSPRARCDSRGNLRKTPPVNAKFSIMPAWQKFSDGGTETSKQNTEAESIRRRPSLGPGDGPVPQPLATNELPRRAEKPEPADTTEGCKFAKDLPSFLVPSPAYPPPKAVAHAEPMTTSDSEPTSGRGKPDPSMPGQEEKASPFGIKLRRTNYSLRFHCDQQTEQKKKKRHSSTGDSADGGAPAPGSTKGERETEGVAPRHGLSLHPERKQALSAWKDSAERAQPAPAAPPGPPPALPPSSPQPGGTRAGKPRWPSELGVLGEKPVLQSRHSLDGSKLAEKVEAVQPLWITLALQKQKGFREQQATREEKKQAREAKQAEKLSKENVSVSLQPRSSSVSRAGSLHKPPAQPEEKKPETAASRLERREQLKKANTLPTSVTVEISDSAPPAPLVKEVTKRFSTPDAAPVSTEPAWLALAKRKAKAWSDCPQIIK